MSAPCPYVGLQPFREEDYLYFFGRERDVRVISSNLLAQPLTVVYGASGVGKSSVLRAGVLPYVRTHSSAAVVYYNTWQSESFLDDFTLRCRSALGVRNGDARLEELVETSGRRLFLVLDQFEEMLLYHQHGQVAAAFDSLLARLVNTSGLGVSVLVGIREDALSRFDQRYSIRIADLLGNTLPLQHLSHDAGRRATLEPLRVFNERHALGSAAYDIEPDLVEEVLRQVQPRQYAEEEVGRGHTQPPQSGEDRVEAPFLQLVLRRLWDEEAAAGSRKLRLETLRRIGGAHRIVEQHVKVVLAGLPSDHDRAIAAGMFKVLVTKSRSKISQATADLVDYAEAPEGDVRKVLTWLSDKPESRILRRLDTPERYEIFHDVLAEPILDWRRQYFSDRELSEQGRKQREESERARREVRRLRWMLAAMAVLAVVAIGLAWYGLDQRRRAREATDAVQTEARLREEATNAAQAERERAAAADASRQAATAEAAGQTELAAQLRRTADTATQQAVESDKKAAESRNQLADAAEGRERNLREALQQIADLKTQVARTNNELEQVKTTSGQRIANLEGERTKLETRISGLTVELEELRKKPVDRSRTRNAGDVFQDCPDCPEMVVIPAGRFTMGSPGSEDERHDNEGPTREVSVPSFALGRYEVTRAQFQAYVSAAGAKVAGCNYDASQSWRAPGFEQTPNDPVVCVNWEDASAFIKWLSQRTNGTYRLPSEAEWEYAARAGTTTRRYWGDRPSEACLYANVADWSSSYGCKDGFGFTAPVGRFKPNAFSLHDMLGNAGEWTQDCWNVNYVSAPTNGGPWTTSVCSSRVWRGGTWRALPPDVRSAHRNLWSSSLRTSWHGFRVARSLP